MTQQALLGNMGQFRRSAMGVRTCRVDNAFNQLRDTVVVQQGIAASDSTLLCFGKSYSKKHSPRFSHDTGHYLAGARWRRHYVTTGNDTTTSVGTNLASCAYGHAGFMAVVRFGSSGSGYRFFYSVDGSQWETSKSGIAPNTFGKMWHGNGVYAVRLGSLWYYTDEWRENTADWGYNLVFHKKTNLFAARGLDDVQRYSEDMVTWTDSTDDIYQFFDADYDPITDKSIAINIGAEATRGVHVSSDAYAWTRIVTGSYGFVFAGGGLLFAGRNLTSSYTPSLLMSDDGGATFTDVAETETETLLFRPVNGIYWKGKYWLSGDFGTNESGKTACIATSTDGTNWTRVYGRL